MANMKYTYIASSERAYRRNDEADNRIYSNAEYKVGDTMILDGLRWTITGVIKNIPVNTKVSQKSLWKLVNAVDSLPKARIAEEWLKANEVIDNNAYNDLMMALSQITRELYDMGAC